MWETWENYRSLVERICSDWFRRGSRGSFVHRRNQRTSPELSTFVFVVDIGRREDFLGAKFDFPPWMKAKLTKMKIENIFDTYSSWRICSFKRSSSFSSSVVSTMDSGSTCTTRGDAGSSSFLSVRNWGSASIGRNRSLKRYLTVNMRWEDKLCLTVVNEVSRRQRDKKTRDSSDAVDVTKRWSKQNFATNPCHTHVDVLSRSRNAVQRRFSREKKDVVLSIDVVNVSRGMQNKFLFLRSPSQSSTKIYKVHACYRLHMK